MHMRVKQVQIILISLAIIISRKSLRFRSCELHSADAHATLQRPNNDFIQKLFLWLSSKGDFFYVISIELSVILIWRQYNAGREKNSKIGGNSQPRAMTTSMMKIERISSIFLRVYNNLEGPSSAHLPTFLRCLRSMAMINERRERA